MKRFIKTLVSLTTLASVLLTTPAYASNTMKVHLNGKEMKFNVDPVVTNNTTMVEFRPLFEQMGLQVVWTPDIPTQIIGKKDGLEITLHIGSKITMVNGKEVDLAVAPQVIDNHTLVPLRFVGEASGKDVKWTGGTDVQVNDTIVASGSTSNNGSTISGDSNTPTNSTNSTSTADSTDLSKVGLKVFFDGTPITFSDSASPIIANRYNGYEQTDWHDFVRGLKINPHGINVKDNHVVDLQVKDNLTITLSMDGVFSNGNKICSVGFHTRDNGLIPIKPIVEAMGYSYSENINGVYITSK